MNRKIVMDSANKHLFAIAVGAGLNLVGFAIQHLYHRHEREVLLREISRLENDVLELRQEVTKLAVPSKSAVLNGDADSTDSSRKRRSRRRRNGSLASGYESEATTGTMFSAFETDDDEFYDLSSDDDTLLESIQRSNLNDTGADAELFYQVDELMKGSAEDRHESLRLLLSHAEELSANVEFLWRLAKAYKLQVDFAVDAEDKESQLTFIDIGMKHAQKAINLDERNGNAQKWFAILVGLKSDFLPVKEKIQNGVLFRKHLMLALEIIPEDHTLHHLLARFKFAVANLSWIERKAASMLGELPNFSMDDAIADALKAEQLSPEPWIENQLLLAKSYVANSNYQEACNWLKKAKSLATPNEVTKKEVEDLYHKYKSYQR